MAVPPPAPAGRSEGWGAIAGLVAGIGIGIGGWLSQVHAAPAPPAGPPPAAAPTSPGAASPHPPAPPLPQLARDAWKDCAYNGETIGCRDEQLAQGLRIVWKDGLRMTYRERPARRRGDPVYLEDRYGGLWRRELLVQGNTVLTNLRSGNRILVPLRLTCRPPLRGEVGYCHP